MIAYLQTTGEHGEVSVVFSAPLQKSGKVQLKVK
jgi:hypothetical protein